MIEWVNLVWALPAACALAAPALGRVSERARDAAAVTVCAVSAVLSLMAALTVPLPATERWMWFELPGLGQLYLGVMLDHLSVLLANVVAWVALAVYIYSLGYMKGDPGLNRYWTFMLLFLGGMELLVLSENLIQMLIGWEVVGLCSYALIGYWFQDREEDRATRWVGEPPEEYPPSHCGLKAFLVTRFADSFLVAGVLALIAVAGTSSITELTERPPAANPSILLAMLVLMYVGAVGKSAQLPLMEWLPDAMAGPSSVSALIHAATMVKAGVYLTARLSQMALAWTAIIDPTPFFKCVAWIGVSTALVAALQASVSTELKKTLAYSTASQIGYMMAALGASYAVENASSSAALHLISHAMFKAALFLAAGAIIHAAGTRFYEGMRGLGRGEKTLFAAVTLSSLSLIGVPPFIGFWSKEAVLTALAEADSAAFAVALTAAALTAFYTVRMLELIFGGANAHPPHEHTPSTMSAPTLALAVAGAVGGIALPLLPFYPVEEASVTVTVLSLTMAALGAAAAWAVYGRGLAISRIEPVVELLRRRLYLNAAYYRLASAVLSTAKAASKLDSKYVRGLSAAAKEVSALSEKARVLQSGVLSQEELLLVTGGALLILLLLLAG